MVNDDKVLPDIPNHVEETLPSNNENVFMATDSDSEDEVVLDGYEPLPLEAPEYDNESSDNEQDSGVDSDNQTPTNENLPPISAAASALVREVWATPSPSTVDIKMDSEKVDEVKQVMANVLLPSSSIPEWANNIPEDQWKEHLYKRLQGLQKSTI
ncbi:hypothetical protein PPYR_11783 [Photinus pyralis]|uniref:Male-enhanced antigen 1 n=1 Tax=Photinus pyralis TaxID=7054 RepID=A0A1Y1KKI6_PHOPY|nr:uncharacterized protein LOC116176845 [Photinus pyralis]KAB0794944.1 hypothetical protein PPYR_11783 [Photinus pyralis]